MRIIGGSLGGRRLHPPAHMPHTRPTTDIAKEGLFNILQNNLELEGMKTLDLFGGTGSISYELASRGASDLTIVEKDEKMHAFISNNIKALQIENCQVIKSDVFRFINQCTDQFDFIFAGPPYALTTIDRLPELVAERKILQPGGWFILEHTPANHYEKFALYKTSRNYGTTIFSIFIEPV
ncbi:MAG: RsmD family RNA methyltransferase [Chitinophagaceae bacterium]